MPRPLIALVLLTLLSPAQAQYADLAFAVSDRFGGSTPNTVCQNDGAGRFTCAAVDGADGASLGVAAFDLDADGDSDLAFANDDGADRLCVQEGLATGTFTCGDVNDIDADPSWGVAAADLDADGDPDLVFADLNEDYANVCLQDGQGMETFTCEETAGYAAGDVAVVDLSGDGLLDLAFTSDSDTSDEVCVNDGAAQFTCTALDAEVGGTSISVAAEDMDGDGDVDLVYAQLEFADRGDTDQLCLNDGSGGFSCTSLGPALSVGVATADLDADGDADLAFSGPLGGDTPNRVCLNDGDAVFACAPLPVSTAGDAEAADLDGDGDLDLIYPGGPEPVTLCLQDSVASGDYTCQTLAVVGAFRVAVGNFGGARVGGGVATEPAPPAMSELAVRPNPSRADAAVTITLTSTVPVRVEAFDVLGRRVAVLHDGPLAAGPHTLTLDATALPAGATIVRVITPTGTASRTVTVVR